MDIEERIGGNPFIKNTNRSMSEWVFIIAVGVIVGNAISFGFFKIYQQWEIRQFTAAFTAMAEVLTEEGREMQRESAAKRQQLAEQNRRREAKREQRRSAYQSAQRTCEFWRSQILKENNSKNRTYRDAACSRARSLM